MIAIVTVLVGVYVFVMVRTQRSYDHIMFVQEELLIQTQLERRARDTSGTLAQLSNSHTFAQRYFRTPDDVIAVIEELEGFGTVIGAPVTVAQVQIQNENTETHEGTLIVHVAASGTWRAMSQLLSLLDTLPYHATVMQAGLETTRANDNGVPIWSLRATLAILLKQ